MRVLFAVDEAHEAIPGGHRVQVERTAEALRALAVDVRIGRATEEGLLEIDLLHSMGADLRQIRLARQARVPVVTSTIYGPRAFALGGGAQSTRRQSVKSRFRYVASGLRNPPYVAAARAIEPLTRKQLLFESSDLLLPNSEAEAEAIRRELRVTTPCHVVPNGVDHKAFRLPRSGSERNGVLYVGRIEPHKNQLGLIKALTKTGIPLTIVGGEHPHHSDYADACRRAAGRSVTFLGQRDQLALVELYQSAAVHAMPSWYETTGLSSLEAALCGAAVVSTVNGYVSEYFGDRICYCDPRSEESIRTAIQSALVHGPHPELREHVLNNFTWEHAGVATKAAYTRALLG